MAKRSSKRRRSNDQVSDTGAEEGAGDGTGEIDSSKLSPMLSMLQPELKMLIEKLSDQKPMTHVEMCKLLSLLTC